MTHPHARQRRRPEESGEAGGKAPASRRERHPLSRASARGFPTCDLLDRSAVQRGEGCAASARDGGAGPGRERATGSLGADGAQPEPRSGSVDGERRAHDSGIRHGTPANSGSLVLPIRRDLCPGEGVHLLLRVVLRGPRGRDLEPRRFRGQAGGRGEHPGGPHEERGNRRALQRLPASRLAARARPRARATLPAESGAPTTPGPIHSKARSVRPPFSKNPTGFPVAPSRSTPSAPMRGAASSS